jgi:hypothetical protein
MTTFDNGQIPQALNPDVIFVILPKLYRLVVLLVLLICVGLPVFESGAPVLVCFFCTTRIRQQRLTAATGE